MTPTTTVANNTSFHTGKRNITIYTRGEFGSMSNRSSGSTTPNDADLPRRKRLHSVSEQLDAVLQSLDLEAESELAEEVATAVRAVERAREIEGESGASTTESDSFVFRPQ